MARDKEALAPDVASRTGRISESLPARIPSNGYTPLPTVRPLGYHTGCIPAPGNYYLPARETRDKGEKRGSEECTQCRGDEPFGTRLSVGLPLQVGGSIPGGWLRAAVPETRDSPLKDSGIL